jgi:hypothetical protein
LFMSILMAASWCQPLQLRDVPVGAWIGVPATALYFCEITLIILPFESVIGLTLDYNGTRPDQPGLYYWIFVRLIPRSHFEDTT